MKKSESIYSLKGRFRGEPYEEISKDIEWLQSFQTKLFRQGGTGFIYRM